MSGDKISSEDVDRSEFDQPVKLWQLLAFRNGAPGEDNPPMLIQTYFGGERMPVPDPPRGMTFMLVEMDARIVYCAVAPDEELIVRAPSTEA